MKTPCLLRHSRRLGFALLTCLVITTHAEAAQTYTITNLGSLSSQYPRSYAYGLNATAAVVGYAYPSNGYFQGFLWKNGVMTPLGYLEAAHPFSVASAVNGSEQVVGWSQHSYTTNGVSYDRAVLWQNGVITDLGTLPNYP